MFLLGDLDVTKILGIGALSLFLCSLIYNWIKTWDYPAGPMGLPLLGYWPFLGEFPNKTLWKLSKRYGDIFSFYIGRQRMICVNDYQMAKEILNHPMALARPPHAFDVFTGRAGFGGMNGEEWQDQRRFAMITMRNLGLGKGAWETMIQECASDLVKEIQKMNGQPFSYTPILAVSQITNIFSLLFGRRLDVEQEKDIFKITKTLNAMVLDNFSAVDLSMNNHEIRKFAEFFQIGSYQEFIYTLRKFEAIFKKEINRRVNSKEERSRDDFIGCYLQEMEKRNKENKPHTFTLENLQGNLFIMFNAAQDSVLASVGWLLLLMTLHQDIQDKICEEIDNNIGRDGVVYYDDKVNLPYTTATMYEMMRYIAINPIFPPRYVLDDIEFGGKTIPRGSHIICNSWAMLHDPRYHDNPMEFRPERFLTENGTKLQRMDGYGPFSFGKRNCPGEGVAMMSMYLYFVSIMQKFKVKSPHGGPPDMTSKCSSASMPKVQDLCFIER